MFVAQQPKSMDILFLTNIDNFDAMAMGGNVHRILLQNEPIFTKRQENTHNEGKQFLNFSYLIIFSVFGRGILEPQYPYMAHNTQGSVSNTVNDRENLKMSACSLENAYYFPKR